MNNHKFIHACIYHPEYAEKNHASQDIKDIDIGFAFACGEGYLNLAKKLFKNHYELNINNHDDCAFRLACRNGHYNVVKWLYKISQKYGAPIDLHIYDNDPLRKACKYGHLKIIKFLFFHDEFDIGAMDEYAFRLACKNGHMNVAIYLLEEDETINIFAKGFHAYTGACINGYLEMEKWLDGLAKKKGTKHVKRMKKLDHFIFKNVCSNGHFDMAQYIYSKHDDFDIACDKDFPFRYSCQRNHMELAVWLFCLSDRYILHIRNDRITYHTCNEYPTNKN